MDLLLVPGSLSGAQPQISAAVHHPQLFSWMQDMFENHTETENNNQVAQNQEVSRDTPCPLPETHLAHRHTFTHPLRNRFTGIGRLLTAQLVSLK